MSIETIVKAKYAEDIEKAIAIGNRYLPDIRGRFPWNAGEWPRDSIPHRSLNLSKSSLGVFFEAALRHRMEIYQVWALAPQYQQSTVIVSLLASLKEREDFMSETKFWLSPPPKIHVN